MDDPYVSYPTLCHAMRTKQDLDLQCAVDIFFPNLENATRFSDVTPIFLKGKAFSIWAGFLPPPGLVLLHLHLLLVFSAPYMG